MTAYGRIFQTKETIHEESKTSGNINLNEERHRGLRRGWRRLVQYFLSQGLLYKLSGTFLNITKFGDIDNSKEIT